MELLNNFLRFWSGSSNRKTNHQMGINRKTYNWFWMAGRLGKARGWLGCFRRNPVVPIGWCLGDLVLPQSPFKVLKCVIVKCGETCAQKLI